MDFKYLVYDINKGFQDLKPLPHFAPLLAPLSDVCVVTIDENIVFFGMTKASQSTLFAFLYFKNNDTFVSREPQTCN